MTESDHRQADENQPSPNPQTRLKSAIASFFSSFNSPIVKVSGIACLSVLVVVSAVAYVVSRHNLANEQQAAMAAPHSPLAAPSFIAKPSPSGRAQQPSSPAPLPVAPAPHAAAPRIAPQPAPVAPLPQYRAAIAPPPPPVAPVIPAPRLTPSLPFGVRMSADRDGLNNGCKHGALVIETSTVTFTCPRDSSKNVAVSARQVRDLDNNGIVVFQGEKYHFEIAGKQKQAVHQMFAMWLANARRPVSERASN